MVRVILFNRFGSPLGDLSPSEVFGLTRVEQINGEHSLTITTTRVLEQGWRVLTCDARGKWREHVVYGVDANHASGGSPIGDYYCVWSLQADLMGTRVSAMPGVQSPVGAGTALDYVLSGTSRWERGTVYNAATGGASMYDTDGWSAMSVLVQEWGGEIDASITVGPSGVTSRQVNYHVTQGDQTPLRRYDFGADIKSVRRTVADGPLYCRITPRGRGEEVGDGYGRRITIASVNGGRDYLENESMVPYAKLPDGNGGYEYPTLEVENGDCETPSALLAWAQGVLEQYTQPNVTYDVDVLQLAQEGADMHGVSLGDAVTVVDEAFGGMRITGRIQSITVNLLDEADMQVVIGDATSKLAAMFSGLGSKVSSLATNVDAINLSIEEMGTAAYIDDLLDRINTEINSVGGYVYITQGYGIRAYDTAVSDPLVGSEASAAVEIKGGTIRIANSKTSGGAWEWRTVFTSGHIAAELVTAVNVTAGYISDASGENYWDLDNGVLTVGSGSIYGLNLTLGGSNNEGGTLTLLDGSGNTIGSMDNTGVYIEGDIVQTMSYTKGSYKGSVTNRLTDITLPSAIATMLNAEVDSVGLDLYNKLKYGTSSTEYYARLRIGMAKTTGSSRTFMWADADSHGEGAIEMLATYGQGTTKYGRMSVNSNSNGGYCYIIATGSVRVRGSGGVMIGTTSPNASSLLYLYGSTAKVNGALTVTGTKNRLVSTENHNNRLMYAYETASPYFGDLGSARTDGDGECIVSIDDIFSETARTDYAYQVFLQACGEGQVYVAEKHPAYFVVRGTADLDFDWEVKARQTGFETLRTEDFDLKEGLESEERYGWDVEDMYGQELDYAQELEALYEAA